MCFPLAPAVIIYYQNTYKRLYQLPQYRWRAILLQSAWKTCTLGVAQRIYDEKRLGPEFGYLKTCETRAALLSIVSSIVWLVVVRDPEGFLWFRRPSYSYRCAVITVSAATTIPNLVLLIQVLVESFATPSLAGFRLKESVIWSLLHLSLFLITSGLYLWMVKRLLLDADLTLYEPVVPIRESLPRAPSASAARARALGRPLSSSPSVDEPQRLPEGHLSRAYALQRVSHLPHTNELSQLDRSGESRATEAEPTPLTTDSRGPNPLGAVASGPTFHEQSSSLRCPTMARFDYMSQTRAGPHSWLSDRLLLMVIGTFSTIILILACIILYEDHFSSLPSPKAKCGLRAPLGCYLICAYAIQRALRPSLFVQSRMSLPEPWIEIQSLIGKSVFIDSDTAASTKVDPRLRAFPARGPNRNAEIGCAEYIRRYNSNPAPCTEYWGHLGRVWNRRARATPLYLLLYFGFAYFLYGKGFRCISDYPHRAGRGAWMNPKLGLPDLQRDSRIFDLKFAVNMCNIILGYPIHTYSVLSFFSFLILWASTVKDMKAKGSSNTDGSFQPHSHTDA